MVDTSDFRSGLNIIIDDEIHTVLEYQQSHQGRGSADVDNNGTVDDADLLIVLFNFGCGS